jgi:Type IV secretion-system coupling protein DNA-binding domain
VLAASPGRASHLLRQLVRALAVADSPGVRLAVRRANPTRIDSFRRPLLTPTRLNSSEVALLAGWPVGATGELPVERSPHSLPPASAIPRTGRLIGQATFPGRERPLALSATDGLGHLHVLGPTGTGKSTFLLNMITQDLEAGRGIVLIEPKGDLIASVLERIPQFRADDIVLLDPSDSEYAVGLNPLAANERPSELVADELLGMFRGMYESWGPRTNDILAAAFLTLARLPGMTLCALPSLLADPAFRHRVVSKVHDPVGLGPFWAGFDAWSEAERTAAIAPSLSRVRPFLLRPQLRRVLGQPEPRFDLSRVFTERKVLLVNLGKGPLGRETAGLLGGFVLSQLWAAALRRAAIPPELRHPVFVYVDEVQDYLRLPTDLADALVQARGLGVGFVLAHQHLSQLDSQIRAAVLTNVRSRLCFQLAGDDARTLASGPVSADDLRELAPFEAYAQLFTGGAVRQWCSVRTLPPAPICSEPATVRRRSREQFGVPAHEVDRALEQLVAGGPAAADDIAPRRRMNRAAR